MNSIDGIIRFDQPQSGPDNMEADNRLLSELAIDSPLTLRLYRWSEPTLSLGHFQQEAEINDAWPFASLKRVQRRTGGGAILHHHEWTYSLTIPNRPELGLKGHSEEIYRSVHNSVVDGLRQLGWDAKLSEECSCALTKDTGKKEAFLCFMRRSPVDVVIGQDKIMGSAQRRGKSGLLQHGSLLLRRSEFADKLPGAMDLPRIKAVSPGFRLSDGLEDKESLEEVACSDNLHEHAALTECGKPQVASSFFPQPLSHSPLIHQDPKIFVDGEAGIWLADRIISGVEKVFRCSWKLI